MDRTELAQALTEVLAEAGITMTRWAEVAEINMRVLSELLRARRSHNPLSYFPSLALGLVKLGRPDLAERLEEIAIEVFRTRALPDTTKLSALQRQTDGGGGRPGHETGGPVDEETRANIRKLDQYQRDLAADPSTLPHFGFTGTGALLIEVTRPGGESRHGWLHPDGTVTVCEPEVSRDQLPLGIADAPAQVAAEAATD